MVSPLRVVENRPSPLLWPLAYTTACTAVQAVMLLRLRGVFINSLRDTVSGRLFSFGYINVVECRTEDYIPSVETGLCHRDVTTSVFSPVFISHACIIFAV